MKRATPLVLLLASLATVAMAGVGGAQRSPPEPRPSVPAAEAHPSFTSEIPCSACHTPEGWEMAGGTSEAGGFDHARTGFPLHGQHLAVGCRSCHGSERPAHRACVSCHRDTHQGRLGFDCSRCHNAVAWTDTDELDAHRLTRFPLTGMHAIAACTDCHRRTGDRAYSAVPHTCISCHLGDYQRPGLHPVHDGSAGNPPLARQCESCHRTTGWSPAIIDPSSVGRGSAALSELPPPGHELRFPIRTGPHQGAPCASCHESPRVPAAVRCNGCHAHSPARIAADHRTVRPGPDARGCLACHPGGMAR